MKYGLAVSVTAILILMVAVMTGCPKPTSETGVISDVVMSKAVDENTSQPIDPTNVFSQNDPGFYCSFNISGFPVGAKLEVKWIYVGGDIAAENITGENYVAETQMATITKEGQGRTYTVYSAQGVKDYQWPAGNYQVVISVDGLEKATTTFSVEQVNSPATE